MESENFFGNPRSLIDSSQKPLQGILHTTTPTATGAVPVRGSAGTPVARDEERIASTIPMPMFVGRPTTMNSFLAVKIPQHSIVGQQRQADVGTSI